MVIKLTRHIYTVLKYIYILYPGVCDLYFVCYDIYIYMIYTQIDSLAIKYLYS